MQTDAKPKDMATIQVELLGAIAPNLPQDVKDQLAVILREHKRFHDALELIAAQENMTLLGCQHDDYHRECEGRKAHEIGANKAFNQMASIAKGALEAIHQGEAV